MAVPLNVLKTSSAASSETLLRYFHQTQSAWSAHVAENTVLDVGTAWVNPQLNRIQIANRMMEVTLPPGMSSERAIEMADQHFAAHQAQCLEWVMNPAASADQAGPLIELLGSRGYTRLQTEIMYLNRLPRALPGTPNQSVKVIPARASFRHAQALHEEVIGDKDQAQRVEARMLHLDDPHFEALLALQDGKAVAHIGVLTVGEIGLITQLFVLESHQRQGIGTLLMGRAIEICARALLKHVMLDVSPANLHAVRLYERFGFRKIGEFVVYQKPMF